MNRRKFIAFAGGSLFCSNFAVAQDNLQLNQRIVTIARSRIGRTGGDRYNSWIFAYNVLMNAGARGPYHGPQGQYAWGRPIGFNELRPGDIVQFESASAFKNRGGVYWSCSGRCTWIVLNRSNGRRPGSVLDIAYMYEYNLVRFARIETADLCTPNCERYFYRPIPR